MDTRDLGAEGTLHAHPRRVVEYEFRLPKPEELRLPKVDLEPARRVAEQVLLTGIGVGVLVARGIVKAAQAANQAGAQAAEHPGPLTRALLSLVRPSHPEELRPAEARPVPLLPIDNYAELSVAAIVAQLGSLTAEQLQVLREYEASQQARPEVLAAIDARLSRF